MASRYNKLPSEILKTSFEEFQFNLTVFYKAIKREQDEMEKHKRDMQKYRGKVVRDGNKLSYGGFNIERNTVKKKKNNNAKEKKIH